MLASSRLVAQGDGMRTTVGQVKQLAFDQGTCELTVEDLALLTHHFMRDTCRQVMSAAYAGAGRTRQGMCENVCNSLALRA